MKKIISFAILSFTFALLLAFPVLAAEKNGAVIDTSKSSKGIVSIQYKNPLTKTIKVKISYGTDDYIYTLKDTKLNNFPLQLGAGEYKIYVLENVSGTKYKIINSDTVTIGNVTDKDLYTNSIQIIDYAGSTFSMTELNALLKNVTKDEDKISTIYNYIVKHLSYDFDKLNNLDDNYIPNNDLTYKAQAGICYDYASLFASILRNNGIPAKLEKGYFTEVEAYHAWNQVFLNGEWVFVDTTYDSQADEYKMEYKMVKDASKFKVMFKY